MSSSSFFFFCFTIALPYSIGVYPIPGKHCCQTFPRNNSRKSGCLACNLFCVVAQLVGEKLPRVFQARGLLDGCVARKCVGLDVACLFAHPHILIIGVDRWEVDIHPVITLWISVIQLPTTSFIVHYHITCISCGSLSYTLYIDSRFFLFFVFQYGSAHQ